MQRQIEKEMFYQNFKAATCMLCNCSLFFEFNDFALNRVYLTLFNRQIY